MKAVVLLLITSAFALSVAAGAFSKASTKQSQALSQSQATTTKAATPIASQEQSNPQPQSIAEVISELQRINLSDTISRDVEIKPATQQLLTRLKHQLRGLVGDVLKTPAAQQEPVSSLKQRAVERLAQQGVTVAPPPFSDYYRSEDDSIVCYGYINEIEFKRPAEHRDLVAITTTLAINCGEDTSFYLFQQDLNRTAKD